MITFIKMAFRNLVRHTRRSVLSALALGAGVALLLLMAAVLEGEMRGSMKSTIELQSGHLQVRVKDYEEDKTSLAWEDLVEDPDVLSAQIAALDVVQLATPRLFASGILSKMDRTVGVRIMGIDPASEANRPYVASMVSGEFLSADDRGSILIGQMLADRLELGVGDSIDVMVNTADGNVDTQSFTVRGIFNTHIPAVDKTTVFMPISKAQAIARAENHASTIFVILNDPEASDAVAGALKTDRYEVRTWQDMNQLLYTTDQFSRAYMFLLYLIVLAITATVIINTLIMSVFERTREIGILASMGMKASHIMTLVFTESGILAVGGILMGLALGGLMVWYASTVGFAIGDMGVSGMLFGDRIYGYLTLADTVTLSATAFVMTLLAGVYPAILAARMEPVTALRGGK